MSNNHIISIKTYSNVLITLLFLTAVTVGVARIDFGIFNAMIAMLIATIKAAFVLLYFMHLKYDKKFYWVIFGTSVSFVFLLYLISKIDLMSRAVEKTFL